MAEQSAVNRLVGGSNPPPGAIYIKENLCVQEKRNVVFVRIEKDVKVSKVKE